MNLNDIRTARAAQAILKNFDPNKWYSHKEYKAIAKKDSDLFRSWDITRWIDGRLSSCFFDCKAEKFELTLPIFIVMPKQIKKDNFSGNRYYAHYFDNDSGLWFDVKIINQQKVIIPKEVKGYNKVKFCRILAQSTVTFESERFLGKINTEKCEKFAKEYSPEVIEEYFRLRDAYKEAEKAFKDFKNNH